MKEGFALQVINTWEIGSCVFLFKNHPPFGCCWCLSTSWWFQICFIFTPTWRNDPIWLILFDWVETSKLFNHESVSTSFFRGHSRDKDDGLINLFWWCNSGVAKSKQAQSSKLNIYLHSSKLTRRARKKTPCSIAKEGKNLFEKPRFHSHLELQTSSFLWLFQLHDSKSLNKKWLFHQTSI